MGEKQGHTLGPWVELETETHLDVEGCSGWQDIGPEGGEPVAVVIFRDKRVYGDGDARGDANARLIAAAPDLLAAVWTLVEHFERVDGDASHKAVIKQATDAIGKATNCPSATGEDSPANSQPQDSRA